MTNTETLYIIELSGQGDREIKFVSEEAYNWIVDTPSGQPTPREVGPSIFGNSRTESVTSWDDPHVPESVENDIIVWYQGDTYDGVWLSSGSWVNDRALAAPPYKGEEKYFLFNPSEKERFDLITEIKNDSALDINLEDGYQGYIY